MTVALSFNRIGFIITTILLGTAIIFHDQTRERGTGKSDLIEVSGPLCFYSFQNKPKGVKEYHILICNYKTTFQIKADFVPSFNKERFEAEVKDGATLYFSVLKNTSKSYWDQERAFVYEIRTDQATYMSTDKTLKIDQSYLGTFGGIGFVLAGLISYALTKLKIKNSR